MSLTHPIEGDISIRVFRSFCDMQICLLKFLAMLQNSTYYAGLCLVLLGSYLLYRLKIMPA